ncbi:DUF4241 domain-containing protein [Paenibacillus sp. N3/727]|uniref:DUF4241 domain-containing protein n=1 Tax=Paenibacillus sp. N3/727 TaxID=2925845 RepID=UPI001F52C6D0|nr:DUF4241 domain-containing protein [Paenibacillus sp. N3/727]UNK19453.1 DUF4241 domain-containing protein [Paenibacillus sp. N3/727]
MIIRLGNFEVNSGQLVVADPCYELDKNTIIMGVLEPAMNGTWVGEVEKVEVRDWGEANAKLTAYHNSVSEQGEYLEWIKCPFVAGVDSGQAGIFDIRQYRIPDADAGQGDVDTENEWYLTCCDITESGEESGVLDGGVVSRTGVGDGAYGVYKAVNEQDQVVGVKIVFIKG